jgi:hypothetical protein
MCREEHLSPWLSVLVIVGLSAVLWYALIDAALWVASW